MALQRSELLTFCNMIALRRLFFTLIVIFLSVSAVLADAKITFAKMTHDFGSIQEKDGDAVVQFEFTNDGDSPLIITRATASCGCTSPSYPKKPLRPGEKGSIEVTYHAKGRPGPFDKSIYVYSNDAKNERLMLTITGNVISSTGMRESYVEELGAGLRLKTLSLNFFDVYPGRAFRTRTLAFYNEGSTPMSLSFRNVPKYLHIECEPAEVQPKGEGRIMVTYETDKVKDWGPRNDQFDIYVRGQETQMHDNRITVMADIWEDFSDLTKDQRRQAPEIEVQSTTINFGRVSQAQTQELLIRNTGHEKLIIRKLMTDEADAFSASVGLTTLKPGETTHLKVTFNPDATPRRSVNQHITIISNDPSNSRVLVNLKASK